MNKTAIIKTALPLFIVLIVSVFSCIQTDQSCAQKELPMVVVSCSYNNAPWAEKSLDSIFMQKYDNFRVIYVDDASEDGTADIVERYIERHNLRDRITLIKNTHRRRKMHNIYNTYHTCKDHEIIVQLDGDDWFAHDHVLSDLNYEYLTHGIWLTYGTHENYPKSSKISSQADPVPIGVINKRTFRRERCFRYMHTRSFYAWLFKLIKLEDTIGVKVKEFEGRFFPVHNDGVMMFAMLEMAYYRFKHLGAISYILNQMNPIRGVKIENRLYSSVYSEVKKIVPLYSALDCPNIDRLKKFEQAKADCILFFDGNGYSDLFECIRAIKKYVVNIDNIVVLHTGKVPLAITKEFSEINFVNISKKAIFYKIIKKLPNDHVILGTSGIKITDQIDCSYCIYELERTFAHGFYLNVRPEFCQLKGVPYQYIIDNMYAWKFACDAEGKLDVHNFDMTLYRKKDILNVFRKKKIKNASQLKKIWNNHSVDPKKVGLFYKRRS